MEPRRGSLRSSPHASRARFPRSRGGYPLPKDTGPPALATIQPYGRATFVLAPQLSADHAPLVDRPRHGPPSRPHVPRVIMLGSPFDNLLLAADRNLGLRVLLC